MKEIPIQQLLNEVRAATKGMSREDLVELLQGLARRMPVEERNGFLADLRWLIGSDDSSAEPAEENIDDEKLMQIPGPPEN